MQTFDREYLTVKECAKRSGISRTKLYPEVMSGSLPSIKLGKRRLIRVQTLRDWLDGMERRSGVVVLTTATAEEIAQRDAQISARWVRGRPRETMAPTP